MRFRPAGSKLAQLPGGRRSARNGAKDWVFVQELGMAPPIDQSTFAAPGVIPERGTVSHRGFQLSGYSLLKSTEGKSGLIIRIPMLIVPASIGRQRKFESRTTPRRFCIEKPMNVLQPPERPDFQAISSFPSDVMNQPRPADVAPRLVGRRTSIMSFIA